MELNFQTRTVDQVRIVYRWVHRHDPAHNHQPTQVTVFDYCLFGGSGKFLSDWVSFGLGSVWICLGLGLGCSGSIGSRVGLKIGGRHFNIDDNI